MIDTSSIMAQGWLVLREKVGLGDLHDEVGVLAHLGDGEPDEGAKKDDP